MTELTGVLRHARRDGDRLIGCVYGDTKGRFEDGDSIVTSRVVSEEGDIVRTRFSVYRVESWAGAMPNAVVAPMALTVEQHLLSCLAEECAEVAERVSKALRFGIGEVQPGQSLTNAERIVVEFQDLMGVAKMLHDRGVLNLDGDDSDALLAKEAKVKKFMVYAKSIGALTGEVA
jgi:hypothetical protein